MHRLRYGGAMTDTDRVSIRRAVRELAGDGCDRRELVNEVATRTDEAPATVANELDELERHGFVYLVGDSPAEVKVP